MADQRVEAGVEEVVPAVEQVKIRDSPCYRLETEVLLEAEVEEDLQRLDWLEREDRVLFIGLRTHINHKKKQFFFISQ